MHNAAKHGTEEGQRSAAQLHVGGDQSTGEQRQPYSRPVREVNQTVNTRLLSIQCDIDIGLYWHCTLQRYRAGSATSERFVTVRIRSSARAGGASIRVGEMVLGYQPSRASTQISATALIASTASCICPNLCRLRRSSEDRGEERRRKRARSQRQPLGCCRNSHTSVCVCVSVCFF